MVQCARAELELRSGEPDRARATLEEVEALAAQIGAGPASQLGRKLANLRTSL